MKKCISFEEQKGTRCIRENVYFGIIFSCLSSRKLCFRFLLSSFVWEIKGFYQRSLGNEFDFRDIMNVSPNILAKNWKTRFCGWKSTGNNDINIVLSLENFCTILLAKEKAWKRIFNTNSQLSQNPTEKQSMPVNWNDIWCYLVIGCFDWKIGVFQQTIVRGLLYP